VDHKSNTGKTELLASAELLFGLVLSELLLLVVFEIMSVVLVEVPIGLVGLVGLVGLPVVLVGMLSVELMGGSVVGTVLLVVVVGGVMLLLHWALRMAPEGGRPPNNHNCNSKKETPAPAAGLPPANLSIMSVWVHRQQPQQYA